MIEARKKKRAREGSESIMCIGGCSKMNGMGTINGSSGCKGCGRGHSAEESSFESYNVAEMVGNTPGIPQVDQDAGELHGAGSGRGF